MCTNNSLGHCLLVSKQIMQLNDRNHTTARLWLSHNPFSAFTQFQALSSLKEQETSIWWNCIVKPNTLEQLSGKTTMIKAMFNLLGAARDGCSIGSALIVKWSNIWCVDSLVSYPIYFASISCFSMACHAVTRSRTVRNSFEQQIKAGQRRFVVRHGKTSKIYGACAAVPVLVKADVHAMDSYLCKNERRNKLQRPRMIDSS